MFSTWSLTARTCAVSALFSVVTALFVVISSPVASQELATDSACVDDRLFFDNDDDAPRIRADLVEFHEQTLTLPFAEPAGRYEVLVSTFEIFSREGQEREQVVVIINGETFGPTPDLPGEQDGVLVELSDISLGFVTVDAPIDTLVVRHAFAGEDGVGPESIRLRDVTLVCAPAEDTIPTITPSTDTPDSEVSTTETSTTGTDTSESETTEPTETESSETESSTPETTELETSELETTPVETPESESTESTPGTSETPATVPTEVGTGTDSVPTTLPSPTDPATTPSEPNVPPSVATPPTSAVTPDTLEIRVVDQANTPTTQPGSAIEGTIGQDFATQVTSVVTSNQVPTLPETGSSSGVLSVMSLLMLLFGSLTVVVSRRVAPADSKLSKAYLASLERVFGAND